MKSIIFGCSGQDGRMLTEKLSGYGHSVIGVSRHQGPVVGSIADSAFVADLIEHHRPDYIFHLAASSTARHDALFENQASIGAGTVNVLESVRRSCPGARVFIAGSGLQFRNEGIAIDEETPFEASSPYALARIYAVYTARYYRSAFHIKVYCGYLFHHDSPMRGDQHINQKIVSTINRIAAGSKEKLIIGDLKAEKEFNYAGDVVDAMWQLVNQEEIYEVVIGSGQARSIGDWVRYCFERKNLNWEDHVALQPGFEPHFIRLVSNPRRLRTMGWLPTVGFEQLADMMIEADDCNL